MKRNLNVSISLPPSEYALLKKLAKALGWSLFVQQEPDSTVSQSDRKELVEKLYGCIQLPENYDYKKELEQAFSTKYNV